MSTDLEKLLALAGVSSRYPDVVLDAIQPLGTVNSRKDGDWIKTEKGWVRVTKDLKATLGTVPAGKPTSKKPSSAPPAPVFPPKTAPPPAPLLSPPAPKAVSATDRAKAALKGMKNALPAASPLPAPPPKQAVPAVSAPAKVAVEPASGDPVAKRAEVAAKIKPLLLKALKSLGDGGSDNDADFHGNTVGASYRTWNLPKDPPSDPSDYDDEDYEGDSDGMSYYDYEELVSKELKNARAKITAALAAHMDSISKIRASVGDKNYVEVEVVLK
jgi:hypothetical protein